MKNFIHCLTGESLNRRSWPIYPVLGLCFGIALFGRYFTKNRIGFFYISEWVFIIEFLILVLLFGTRRIFDSILKFIKQPISKYLLVFFAYGLVKVCMDALSHERMEVRYFQKTGLFIFPLMWGVFGYLLSEFFEKRILNGVLVSVILGSAIPYAYGDIGSNFAIGPIFVLIPIAYRHYIGRFNFFYFILLGLSLFPFTRMWSSSVQRTSFGLWVIDVVLVATLFESLQFNFKSWLRSVLPFFIAIFISIFCSGVYRYFHFDETGRGRKYDFDMSEFNSKAGKVSTLSDVIKMFVLLPLQHGDDLPTYEQVEQIKKEVSVPTFQLRTRKFMWNDALEMWRRSPIFGIGFSPEVPEKTDRGSHINDGGYEFKGSPPQIGPHNSYLNIMVRMGVVGIAFFIIWLILNLMAWVRVFFEKSKFDEKIGLIFVACIFVNGALHAFINVGFESPHHCIVLWLIVGILASISPKMRAV